jgi:hypothetical protein
VLRQLSFDCNFDKYQLKNNAKNEPDFECCNCACGVGSCSKVSFEEVLAFSRFGGLLATLLRVVLVTADPDEIEVASQARITMNLSLRKMLRIEKFQKFATLSEASSDAAMLSVWLSWTELSKKLGHVTYPCLFQNYLYRKSSTRRSVN